MFKYDKMSTIKQYGFQEDVMKFTKGFLLQDGKIEGTDYFGAWHYPCCCEHDGKLYVIYSANTGDGNTRGAVVSVIDISEI